MANPDRVAFTVFGKDIYWYGVLMAIGIIIGVLLAIREGERKKLPKDTVLDMCLVIIPSGVIGARLYYVLFQLDYYLANPIKMLYVWEGGLAIYGAVIGGLLGAFIFSRIRKLRFSKLSDCIAPGLILAQAIGRWGNFFNQEAFGRPVTDASMCWFPLAVKIEGIHYFDNQICTACVEGCHLATFFYESMWCLLVFVFVWLMRKRFKHDGDTFLTVAGLYCLERMVVEGLRGDSLWLIRPDTVSWISDGIRVSQLISAIIVLLVAVFVTVRALREKKTGKLMWPAPLNEDEAMDAQAEEPCADAAGDMSEKTEEEAQAESVPEETEKEAQAGDAPEEDAQSEDVQEETAGEKED